MNYMAYYGEYIDKLEEGQTDFRSAQPELGDNIVADSIENVVKLRSELSVAMKNLGCNLEAPFETLSFVALPVTIGNLKICEEGLVDVWKDKLVDVVVS